MEFGVLTMFKHSHPHLQMHGNGKKVVVMLTKLV